MKSIQKASQFFLRLFYDPYLYRHIAFREQGYGIKRLIVVLFIFMTPSYFSLIYHIQDSFKHQWTKDIKQIPKMYYQHYELLKTSQMTTIDDKLKTRGLDLEWLPAYQLPSMTRLESQPQYLLGTYNFFVKIPNYNIFGYQILNKNLYLPMAFTNDFKRNFISGQTILNAANTAQIIYFVTMYWLICFFSNSALVVLFIRTFGYIAPKMVQVFMHETLLYPAACRMLSASGVIPLCILAISLNTIAYQDHHKYVYLIIYMLNFYYALRLITSKSISRWMAPSA
jgi:hypothetical protein